MAEIEVRITKTQKPLLIMFLENLVVNRMKGSKISQNGNLGLWNLDLGLSKISPH